MGVVPPLPATGADDAATASTVPAEVLRIVRLAVSAARADGELSAPERALILEHAGDELSNVLFIVDDQNIQSHNFQPLVTLSS